MRRLTDFAKPVCVLILWLLGSGGEIAAQVPNNQTRIRETTKDILARPEFGIFPRLQSLPAEQRFSSRTTENGIPRFQSRRPGQDDRGDGPQEDAGNEQGNGGGADNGRPRRRIPGEVPPDAPDGDPGGGNGNLQNPREALGEDDIFPEAGELNRLLEGEDFAGNADPERGPDDLNNERNGPENPRPDENRQNAGGENNRHQAKRPAENPHAPPEANAGPRENPGRANRMGNRRDALPAPRPRETDPAESQSSRPRRQREVGTFARVVGAVFHIVAWTILAVICGLILWLIVKAIADFERPAKLHPAHSGSGFPLDLQPAQAPGELPADVYITQARRLAEHGQYREAVVQLVLGAMSRVERAGWVRFRQGMTVRDYLKSVEKHPAAYEGFRSIIRVFEPLTFGRREPTRAHFDKSLDGYETGFGRD